MEGIRKKLVLDAFVAGMVLAACATTQQAQAAGSSNTILGTWVLKGDKTCSGGAWPATFTWLNQAGSKFLGTYKFGCDGGSGNFTQYDTPNARKWGNGVLVTFFHSEYTLTLSADGRELVGPLHSTKNYPKVVFQKE